MKIVLPIVIALAGLTGLTARGLVSVTDHPLKLQQHAGKERRIKAYTLASEVANYTLNADYSDDADVPGRISSHWWAWTTGLVPIGMTEPSNANWYFQAFFNWTFDEESLHDKAFTAEVIRASGPDGMVAYTWDTPTVKATMRFAMVAGSDKLLLFAHYEPKVPVERSRLLFTCYPTGFVQPRNRAVTTAKATTTAPGAVTLDLAAERWILYEDLTEGRAGAGPCGMLIGTPEHLHEARIDVGTYAISTHIELKPEARSLALALYEFPSLPDLDMNRNYFRATADLEARALGEMAAGDLERPLPALPQPSFRQEQLTEMARDLFDRPAETWRPNTEALSFSWAHKLPGDDIRTVLFTPRFAAFETMELARRLALDVQHLYADRANAMISADAWPYSGNTGVGALPQSAVSARAVRLVGDPDVELFFCAGLDGAAMLPVARQAIIERVAQGTGLLLTGADAVRADWPETLFTDRDMDAEETILAGMDWDRLPGLADGEPGRLGDKPVHVYRYARGRVVHFRTGIHRYSAIVPRTNAREGLEGAMDRALALCARAAMFAAAREPAVRVLFDEPGNGGRTLPVVLRPEPPAGCQLRLRIQDGHERILAEDVLSLPLPDGHVRLPGLPAGTRHYVDAMVVDPTGACLGFGFRSVLVEDAIQIGSVVLEPAARNHPEAPLTVALTAGGRLRCTAIFSSTIDTAGWRLRGEVRDTFGRVLARQTADCLPGQDAATLVLSLARPVTVCHVLDIELLHGTEPVAFRRERFTVQPRYPLDDFTVLMWTYAGAPPVLQHTDRLCYEWGADMMDLCHMGGYNSVAAAREYDLSARSGLRLLPYITRLAGTADAKHQRLPGLRDPAAIERTSNALRTTCAQAAPYAPVAYTLGDENYLFRGAGEVCHRPESMAAFREWLPRKYGTIADMNRAWDTEYAAFDEITPMLLQTAAQHPGGPAPWIDHKRFMDDEFSLAHERYAEVIREVDPGTIVGWDGFLGYSWRSGYDFEKLTANLLLNQTYTTNWPQGEFVRSFKQPGALTGMWGNATADTEDGWRAFPWACLLQGDNSVWWWTSWGLEYIPFNPDLSPSLYATWFFDAVREPKEGIGKLLLHGRRDARIAVLYNQPDLFAQAVVEAMEPKAALAGDRELLRDYATVFRAILDYGTQFEAVSAPQVEADKLRERGYDAVWLCRATCLSDAAVASLERFVDAGGTLIVNGGAALLDGNGTPRPERALNRLLGVEAPAGLEALRALPKQVNDVPLAMRNLFGRSWDLGRVSASIPEPGLRAGAGQVLVAVDETPLIIAHVYGRGRAITLNLSLRALDEERRAPEPGPFRRLAAAILEAAGVQPYCRLESAAGHPPRCLWQVRFEAGSAVYLALQQDFGVRGLEAQDLHVTLPAAAVVYDVRTGHRIGNGLVQEWATRVGRGDPKVYALMPYAVAGIEATVPENGQRGASVPVRASLRTDGADAGFHVVRLDVYAPGNETPHRQYSQNLACPAGQGTGDIPFALSDPPGPWRLEFRDIASGTSTSRICELR